MRTVVVALLVVLIVALTTGASGEKAGSVLRGELAGQSVRLTLPTGDGKPKGLVVWFHGQGGNVNDRADGPFLEALRRDGWAIAASDFHAESWGNPASTEDARLLTEWAEGEADVPTVLWVSGSMGGAVSLNAMTHGVTPPPCWYGVKPAIALTEMDEVPGGPRYINSAFGGRVPDDRDPVANVDRLPMETRYRIIASEEDQLVLFRENAEPLARGLAARGADVTGLYATGTHDDPSHFNATDVVDYANSCR